MYFFSWRKITISLFLTFTLFYSKQAQANFCIASCDEFAATFQNFSSGPIHNPAGFFGAGGGFAGLVEEATGATCEAALVKAFSACEAIPSVPSGMVCATQVSTPLTESRMHITVTGVNGKEIHTKSFEGEQLSLENIVSQFTLTQDCVKWSWSIRGMPFRERGLRWKALGCGGAWGPLEVSEMVKSLPVKVSIAVHCSARWREQTCCSGEEDPLFVDPGATGIFFPDVS